MQVNIKFDTEKESVDDLRRLVASLQDLINQREKMPATSVQMQRPMQVQAPVSQAPPRPSGSHTTGGGKIMEYDPAIGDLLSKFASGK